MKSRNMLFATESEAYEYAETHGITNFTVKAVHNGWRLDWSE
jgi:hypothetical protein